MIERALMAYLTPLLPDVRVGTKVPNPRPDSFVTVTSAGGPRQNIRQDRSMVTVQAWAAHDADLLMQQVRDLIHDLPGRQVTYMDRDGFGTVQMYTVTEIGGPANYPDPDSAMPRYQMTVEVRHSHN